MNYPYPILDWKNDEYPDPSDLNLDEWKWEFLRRNPKYQELYRIFENCPDSSTLQDGTSTVKNGKWKGAPRDGMRFFIDCYFYADPPPLLGESLYEYEHRTDGDVIPFADYLGKTFKIYDSPVKPESALPEHCGIAEWYFEDSISPPWLIDLVDLNPKLMMKQAPELIGSEYEKHVTDSAVRSLESITDKCAKNPALVTMVFDAERPFEKQLSEAREILKVCKEDLLHSSATTHYNEGDNPNKPPSIKYKQYPHYIRVLDAIACGASPQEIASVIYPLEPNDHSHDNRVTKKVRGNIKAATQLRDVDYWKLGL